MDSPASTGDPGFRLSLALCRKSMAGQSYVLVVYIGLSLVTFLAYAVDKSAAINGRWRMPEKTLHLLSVAGGWPGALLAQQLLRHNCSMPSFVAVFWITVAANVAGFFAWHSGLLRDV